MRTLASFSIQMWIGQELSILLGKRSIGTGSCSRAGVGAGVFASLSVLPWVAVYVKTLGPACKLPLSPDKSVPGTQFQVQSQRNAVCTEGSVSMSKPQSMSVSVFLCCALVSVPICVQTRVCVCVCVCECVCLSSNLSLCLCLRMCLSSSVPVPASVFTSCFPCWSGSVLVDVHVSFLASQYESAFLSLLGPVSLLVHMCLLCSFCTSLHVCAYVRVPLSVPVS